MAFFYWRWIFVTVSTLFTPCIGKAALSVDPDYGTLFVFAPSPTKITCSARDVRTGEELNWYKGNEKASLKGYILIKRFFGEKEEEVTLSKTTTNFSDAGEYRCQLGSHHAQIIKVVVVKVTTVQTEYDRGMNTATLACKLIESPGRSKDAKYTMHWELNNEKINNTDKYDIYNDNGTLIIHEPEPKDAGQYFCVYTFGRQIKRIPVSFRGDPYVKKFEKSRNLIQGNPMTLKCTVYGYPNPDVSWFKDNKIVNDIDRINVTTDDKPGLKIEELRIPSVDICDSGEYTCVAFSSEYNKVDIGSITVRVKDNGKGHGSNQGHRQGAQIGIVVAIVGVLVLWMFPEALH